MKFVTTYYGQVTGKKNSKMIAVNRYTGKPFVRMNDKAKEQEMEMVEDFRFDKKVARLRDEDLVGKRFRVEMEIWNKDRIRVEMEIWNKDRRKHDLDNQVSTVLDALVRAEVLPDDSAETVWFVSAEYMGVDKKMPRVKVVLDIT